MKKKKDVQAVPSIPQRVCDIVRGHLPVKSTTTFIDDVEKDLEKLSHPISLDAAFKIYFEHALQWHEPEAKKFFDDFYRDRLGENAKDGDFLIAYYTLWLLGLEDLVLLDQLKSVTDMPGGFSSFSDLKFDFVREVAWKAKGKQPVLIIGDTGTSKEMVAQAIHRLSGRKGEYFTLDCTGLPEQLVESELFGHVKGAFTGATEDRKGFFEHAKGGTVFLDELGKMPRPQQAKLLRAIEAQEIRKTGGNKIIDIDVRFVAAIQPKDESEILPDLKWRLGPRNALRMTPLKERLKRFKGDTARDIIIRALNNVLAHSGRRDKIYKITVNEDALKLLVAYDFPGNYRDLEDILRRAVERLLMAGRNDIMPDDLSPLDSHASSEQQNTHDSAEDIDKIKLRDIFKHANKAAAAVVMSKVKSIQAKGLSLKQAITEEGATVNEYQTVLRKIERYTGLKASQIEKGVIP